MLEITPDDIANLRDDHLRALVGRLCEAELRQRGLPLSALTYGGNQDAPDGGVDVRICSSGTIAPSDFLPRPDTVFQVKKPAMSASDILSELRPRGIIRPSIVELVRRSGAYVLISSGSDVTDSALEDRRKAMRIAVADLPSSDFLFLDFYDRSRLAIWLRNHPGLIPWVRTTIGRSIQGWRSYDAWAYSPDGIQDNYLEDDALRVRSARRDREGMSVADGIQAIRTALIEPQGVVRLAGLSGVGKTRLAQALFDARVGNNSIDPALVIYADMGDEPFPHPTHMAENLAVGGDRIILVIDNCPRDLHRRLTDICRRPNSNLSTLTIEFDIQEDEPEGTEAFRLEPSSTELIQQLIRRRCQNLSPIDAETIARFSGGNFRSALIIADTVERNETVASLSDEELIRRLFHQRSFPDETLMRAAQACAIVYSFEGESFDGDKAELPQLASLAGIGVDDLYARIATLRRRDIIQHRSVWRAVLPHTIANNLAKLALQNFPIQKIVAAMNSERLFRSFARRLGYLHDSKEAQSIVVSWLGPNGFLAFLDEYNEFKSQVFEYIAPVAPPETLATLHRMIGRDSKQIALSSWMHNRVARILQSLAYDPELFEESANLLVVLSEAEARDKRPRRQYIADITASLFQIHHSGTHAPIEMRVATVKSLLASEDENRRSLGIEALEALLGSRNFQANRSFEFGARTRDYGFWPKDHNEIVNWFESALRLVEAFGCIDNPTGAQIRSAFARSFAGLWWIDGLADQLEHVARRVSNHQWQEGWIAVRKMLRKSNSQMSDRRTRLEALELLLRPDNLIDRTRAVVFTQAWGPLDYADIDESKDEETEQTMARYERATRTARELGENVATDDNAFSLLLPELVSSGGHRLTAFGIGLATPSGDRANRWNALISAARQAPAERRNYAVLCGFVTGLHASEPSLCDRSLDALIEDPIVGPWLPVLQVYAPLNSAGVNRLRRMLDQDIAPIERYASLANGRYLDEMSSSEFKLLIDCIQKKSGGFPIACDILSMRLHTDRDKNRDDHDVAEAGRSLLKEITFDGSDNMQDHRLTQIARNCLRGHAGATTAAAIIRKLKSESEVHNFSSLNSENFISTLFEMQPIATLDSLFCDGEIALGPGRNVISDISLNHKNPLDSVPDKSMINWCDAKPSLRYQMMSRLVSYCRATDKGGVDWTHVALDMLRRAPDPIEVLWNFVERFLPTMWEGSRATYIEQRTKLLHTIQDDFSRPLAAFAQTKLAELQNEIDRHRMWEMNEDSDRDQRFE